MCTLNPDHVPGRFPSASANRQHTLCFHKDTAKQGKLLEVTKDGGQGTFILDLTKDSKEF